MTPSGSPTIPDLDWGPAPGPTIPKSANSSKTRSRPEWFSSTRWWFPILECLLAGKILRPRPRAWSPRDTGVYEYQDGLGGVNGKYRICRFGDDGRPDGESFPRKRPTRHGLQPNAVQSPVAH